MWTRSHLWPSVPAYLTSLSREGRAIDLKTPILILHCLGFALGLGGATILDLPLLRSLRRPLDLAEILCFEAISKIVALALTTLWLSGLNFLVLYKWTSPGLLDNPKLWAKRAIVGVLTVTAPTFTRECCRL